MEVSTARALARPHAHRSPLLVAMRCATLRAVSFDETRLDDKTHGDGGDRAGRTERIVRCGKWDDGESIGQKLSQVHADLRCQAGATSSACRPFSRLATVNVTFWPSLSEGRRRASLPLAVLMERW